MAWLILSQHPSGLAISSPAPLNDSIKLLSGRTASFKSLGSKPLVLNFWATWCPPCHKELPTLGLLATKYKAQVVFIGAAVDSNIEDIIALKQDFALNYTLGLVSPEVVSNWQANTLPTTYIIDSNGLIAWSQNGLISEESLSRALDAILKK